MDRQLIVRPRGQNFHVVFHNYMGPFEGRQIGNWLNLREVEDPPDSFDHNSLQLGEFYMEHPMERHPNLHALVRGDQLEAVARAVDHFHVHVVEGEGILPELPPEKREPRSEYNYIEAIELSHQSVWSKGPKAVLQAFVLRAIPAVVVVLALVVGSRHLGGNRQDVGLAEVFARASRPEVSQGAISRLWNPDRSNELRTTISAVRCIEGEKVILADGTIVQFRGMGNVRPMLEDAAAVGSLPRIEVDIVDGRAQIASIRVGDRLYGRGVNLVELARLGPTDDEPDRERAQSTDHWWMLDEFPEDAREVLDGRRVSFEGTLQRTEDGVVLKALGRSFALTPARALTKLDSFLDAMADGSTELIVDVVLNEFPRQADVFARGQLYSVSAQNFHIVARR